MAIYKGHCKPVVGCSGCSHESCAEPANETLSTLFVSTKVRASPVIWLAAAKAGHGGDVTSDCLSASPATWSRIYLDIACPQD